MKTLECKHCGKPVEAREGATGVVCDLCTQLDTEGDSTRPKRAPRPGARVCMLCGQPLGKKEKKVCTECRISAHRKDPLPPEAYCGPTLTPLKAVHARCVDCNSDPGVDVRAWARCDFDDEREELCPLWPYRFARNPSRQGLGRWKPTHAAPSQADTSPSDMIAEERLDEPYNAVSRRLAAQTTPMKAIREACRWCSADQPREIALCPATKCALWPYRYGRRKKP